MLEMIEEFQSRRFEWKYNLVGLLLSRINIKRQKIDHYFCSEFVAELLAKAKILTLRKKKSRYLPYHLKKQSLFDCTLFSKQSDYLKNVLLFQTHNFLQVLHK